MLAVVVIVLRHDRSHFLDSLTSDGISLFILVNCMAMFFPFPYTDGLILLLAEIWIRTSLSFQIGLQDRHLFSANSIRQCCLHIAGD